MDGVAYTLNICKRPLRQPFQLRPTNVLFTRVVTLAVPEANTDLRVQTSGIVQEFVGSVYVLSNSTIIMSGEQETASGSSKPTHHFGRGGAGQQQQAATCHLFCD